MAESINTGKNTSKKYIIFIICSIIFICCCCISFYLIFTQLNNEDTENDEPIITINRPKDTQLPFINTITIFPTDPKNTSFPQKSVPISNVIIQDKKGNTVNHIATYNIKVGQKYYDYGVLTTATLPFYLVIIEPTNIDNITIISTGEGFDLNLYSLTISFSNVGKAYTDKLTNSAIQRYGYNLG